MSGLQRWTYAGVSASTLLLLLALPAAPAGVVKIERISPPPLDLEVPLPGAPGTLVNVGHTPLDSGQPAISADGQWVAFVTAGQVFERSRLTGSAALVSITPGGAPGNGPSSAPAISADGRFVAFASTADNLAAGDMMGSADVFLWDRQSGKVELVSVSASGVPANGESRSTSISADGRFVAFQSAASNLVPGDGNGVSDVFVRDRQTATTELVSVTAAGVAANGDSYGPSISGDGRFVTFVSAALNLPGSSNVAGLFVRDRQRGRTEHVPADTYSYLPAISADGRFVAYMSLPPLPPGPVGVSYGFDGPHAFGEPLLGGSVSVYDRQAGKIEAVSDQGFFPAISADGRFVAFESYPSGLTSSQAEIYVRDRKTGSTEIVSDPIGGQANGPSGLPAISADGQSVAFASYASNLVPGDDNGRADVFVAERG